MKIALATLVAISATCFGLAAHAADDTTAPALSKQEAKDAKTQSDAAYKARKDVAEANHELNKGDCEVAADGSTERACKKDAKAVKKQEKTEAKVIHEAEKDAIKAGSK